MRTLLLIILVLLLIGAFPAWPYSTGWGYYPSGGLGLVLLIVLILWLMGTNLSWHAGIRSYSWSKAAALQSSDPEACFKTISERQARIVNCYRASQKSVNKMK